MLLEIKGHCRSEFCAGTLLHFSVKALCAQSLRLHFPSSQADDPVCNVHFQLYSAAPSPLLKWCLTQLCWAVLAHQVHRKYLEGGRREGRICFVSAVSGLVWCCVSMLMAKGCSGNRPIPLLAWAGSLLWALLQVQGQQQHPCQAEPEIPVRQCQTIPSVHPALVLFVWHVGVPWELGQHPLRCCCCAGRSLKWVGGTVVLISSISWSVPCFSAQQSTWHEMLTYIHSELVLLFYWDKSCSSLF